MLFKQAKKAVLIHRIDAGVAFLQEKYPGWLERVEANRIDQSDPHDCVLAQVTGYSYNRLAVRVNLRNISRGFFLPLMTPIPWHPSSHWYDQLTVMWRERVAALQGKFNK